MYGRRRRAGWWMSLARSRSRSLCGQGSGIGQLRSFTYAEEDMMNSLVSIDSCACLRRFSVPQRSTHTQPVAWPRPHSCPPHQRRSIPSNQLHTPEAQQKSPHTKLLTKRRPAWLSPSSARTQICSRIPSYPLRSSPTSSRELVGRRYACVIA